MAETNKDSKNFGKCANPTCEETGKLKCAGCSSVYYCSQQCQKTHWSEHKTVCKKATSSSPTPSSPTPATAANKATSAGAPNAPVSEPHAQLQTLKGEIQKHFSMGDFETAIKKSDDALQLAKTLPPLIAVSETIQLHINLSTAFIHLNRVNEAESHAEQAVKNAEIAVSQRPNQPQPIEVLSIALGSRAVALLTNNKLDEALETAQKALTLAETIYPKNDPRLHKSLRSVGLILDKKGDTTNAEITLVKAYTIICIAGGPHTGEAQLLTEDLVGMFIRKNDLENAEKYARKNYKGIKDKTNFTGNEKAVLADSASRLANILLRKGDHTTSESLIEEALEIRQSKEFSSLNPLGIAFSLTQLVAVRELLNKLDNESEDMLKKAIDIFGRMKGPNSPEVINTLNQLKNIRNKNKGGSSSPVNASRSSVTVEDVDDDEDDETEEAKGSNKSLTKASSSSAKTTKKGDNYDITPLERSKIDALPPNDGVSRMQLAGLMYEQNKFATAELLLSQAYNIFLKSNGPDHEHTKAAKQNLGLVRNNRLNQLWMQVVTEEILKFEELKITDPADEVNSPKAGKSASSKSSEGFYSKALEGNGTENTDLTLEERLFLQNADKEKPQSNCVIC